MCRCSYGKFRGGRASPVCLPGRRRRGPGAAHPQFPPAAGHMVQRRTQDSPEQPHVSIGCGRDAPTCTAHVHVTHCCLFQSRESTASSMRPRHLLPDESAAGSEFYRKHFSRGLDLRTTGCPPLQPGSGSRVRPPNRNSERCSRIPGCDVKSLRERSKSRDGSRQSRRLLLATLATSA